MRRKFLVVIIIDRSVEVNNLDKLSINMFIQYIFLNIDNLYVKTNLLIRLKHNVHTLNYHIYIFIVVHYIWVGEKYIELLLLHPIKLYVRTYEYIYMYRSLLIY